MIDLKFRVWDKERENYLDKSKTGVAFKPNIDPVIIHDGELFQATNNVIIEQFIGCSDGNKNDIYEGDILEWTTNMGTYRSEVIYSIEICKNPGFVLSSSLIPLNELVEIAHKSHDLTLNVVGNIHENADLLEDD